MNLQIVKKSNKLRCKLDPICKFLLTNSVKYLIVSYYISYRICSFHTISCADENGQLLFRLTYIYNLRFDLYLTNSESLIKVTFPQRETSHREIGEETHYPQPALS